MTHKMNNVKILEKLSEIAEQYGLYKKEAYLFILVALEYTVANLTERRHLSGQELSKGIANFAREQYGYMAATVIENWGIHSTADFGTIVYHMIENKLLAKTETDSIEDFDNVFEFESEFIWENVRPREYPERF